MKSYKLIVKQLYSPNGLQELCFLIFMQPKKSHYNSGLRKASIHE